jgi:hypothetical protein
MLSNACALPTANDWSGTVLVCVTLHHGGDDVRAAQESAMDDADELPRQVVESPWKMQLEQRAVAIEQQQQQQQQQQQLSARQRQFEECFALFDRDNNGERGVYAIL